MVQRKTRAVRGGGLQVLGFGQALRKGGLRLVHRRAGVTQKILRQEHVWLIWGPQAGWSNGARDLEEVEDKESTALRTGLK